MHDPEPPQEGKANRSNPTSDSSGPASGTASPLAPVAVARATPRNKSGIRLLQRVLAPIGIGKSSNSKGRARAPKRQFEIIDARQMESLQLFHDVARALTSSLELEPLLMTIMSKMEQFFGPERWSLMMIDEETNELYYALTAGMDDSGFRHRRLQMGEGIAGYVAKTGYPLIIPDVEYDTEWSAYAHAHPDLNLQSIACLPIAHGDRMLGVMQLHNCALDLLPDTSMAFLRVLCDYAAIALQNARSVKLIHQLSITDDCTGLYNARYLYETLEEEIASGTDARVVSIHRGFSLVFLDLDYFKTVNDTHGHAIGSRLLAEIGSMIKRALGPDNPAFRYGGDEFVAVLRGMDKPRATLLVEAIREKLNETRFLTGEGLSVGITASFGLATFPEDGNTMQGIIRSADAQMYCAKAAGRNRISIADPDAPATTPVKVSRHS